MTSLAESACTYSAHTIHSQCHASLIHVQPANCVFPLQITGKGPLAQVGVATGVPISQVSIGLLAFIGFFLVAAVFEGNYGEEKKEDYSQY